MTQIKQSFSASCLVPTYAAIVSVKEKAAFFFSFSFSEENDFETQCITHCHHAWLLFLVAKVS